MNTKTAQDVERNGKAIAIVGVIFFGTSIIGHLHYKDRLNAISSQIGTIDIEIRTTQAQQSLKIKSLESRQKSCEERPRLPNFNLSGSNPPLPTFDEDTFFGCDSASINKRATEIADLKTQLKGHVQALQKPLPSLYQQGNQENFKTQAFFYSSIVALAMSTIGLLMIFGRSLAFINRGGDISIGDIHNSKLPINSGHGNTAIAADTLSDLSVENYSHSVRSSISHLPMPSDPNTAELKQILMQIQELITTSSELSHGQKLMALEQVKVLTEASVNPTDSRTRKFADQAILVLKGIAASLPDAANITESLSKLLPMVSALIGLIN